MPRAVLLFSGSLESQLAARLLQTQGIEIAALFVRTPWGCGDHQPEAAAQSLGLELHSESVEGEFCDPLTILASRHSKATRFCGDCHLYLARCARQYMTSIGADFVATGDVLGQKASNQKRRDFDRYAYHAGLRDRLLWPLSAQHLTPTLPETCGWIDRQQLAAFCGRRRASLKAAARELGLAVDDCGRHGCPLGQTGVFGQRVLDHVSQGGSRQPGDFALLRLGEHLWASDATRIILGRRQAENEALDRLWHAGDTDARLLIQPDGFPGPTALLVGPATAAALDLAISALLRYAKHPTGSPWAVISLDRIGIRRRISGPPAGR